MTNLLGWFIKETPRVSPPFRRDELRFRHIPVSRRQTRFRIRRQIAHCLRQAATPAGRPE